MVHRAPRLPSYLRAIAFRILSPVYIANIYGLPLVLVYLVFSATAGNSRLTHRIVVIALAPLALAISGGLIAGLFSRLHQPWILPGKMSTELGYGPYLHRRLYGLCWTSIYYAKPVYHLLLAIPLLKRALFRLFGYSGDASFTTYPDTWIRDLPLLEFGPKVYLSNRATIGTNVVLANGTIIVDRIILGARTLVGHLAMLAPGVHCDEDVSIGVGCAIGMRVQLGKGVEVGPTCTIDHYARIDANTRIGTYSYVGTRARLGPGLRVPPHSNIPSGTRAYTQEALNVVLGSLRQVGAPSARSEPVLGPIRAAPAKDA